MSKKNSSLNVLRKSNKESFFLQDSDEEDQHLHNDDDELDVDNMDFPLPTDDDAMVPSASTPLTPEQRAQIEAMMGAGSVGGKGNVGADGVRYVSGDELEQFKSWMCIYPCYIDGTKTVAEGRRISQEQACKKQPWAKDIVEALKELQLSQAFEPGKTHPRDWANRGRVRVLFKDNGRLCHPTIHTKRALLVQVAASINRIHAREAKSSAEPRSEYSPLSPLTPLSIVMPGMANSDPLAGFLGGSGNTDNAGSSSSHQQSITDSSQPNAESKRQKKLAKKPKRVMIRG
ncbi:signal recognition particle subunit [Podila epigama]|nr:signal recognition particle subunit [Podila epigama]